MNTATATKSVLLAALVTATASVYGQSQPMSYTSIEGSYVRTDLDGGFNNDGDGVDIAGSFAVTDALFLKGGYRYQDFDFGVDVDQYELGLGGHRPLADGLDVVGSVSYLRSEVDFAFGNADDDGIGLALGLRGRLTDALELEGGVSYADLDNFADDLALNFGGRYYFNPQFALGAGIEAGDDVTTWNVGLRYDFR